MTPKHKVKRSEPDAITRLIGDLAALLADQTGRIANNGDEPSMADIRHLSAAITDTIAAAKSDEERQRANGSAQDEKSQPRPGVSPEVVEAIRRSIVGDG